MLTYQEALAYIAGLAPRGWRLGLDRMQELADRVDVSDSLGQAGGPQYIHVTGTNGKGSVTSYLQSILNESGYRTGAYFSPFVYDFRERIQLGRELISKEDLTRLTAELAPKAETMTETDFGGATEFEFKTALALAYWKEMRAEWVALEVGLGGRLDATNIVTPRASVIVSISLDHTSILGHSVEEIAREKAGIIKPGVPVVVGDLPPEALAVVEAEAAKQGSPIWRLGSEIKVEGDTVATPPRTHINLVPGLRGVWQRHNMALAVAAIDASGAYRSEQAVRQGVKATSLPGRFEVVRLGNQDVVFDGAHNAAAAQALAETLKQEFPGKKVVLLTGMISGHDPEDFYTHFATLVKAAHFSPINFHRAVDPKEVLESVWGLIHGTAHPSLAHAIDAALSDLSGDDVLVVTGSFYLLGEARPALEARLNLLSAKG